jgi:RNA recognition motif-containing protein
MSSGVKKFGIMCGIVAFLCCLLGSISILANGADGYPMGFGLLGLGFSFFAGPMLIVFVSAGAVAKAEVKVARNMPAKGKKPVTTAKPKKSGPKPAAKADEKPAKGPVRVYIGNLSVEAGETEVKTTFSAFGQVDQVRLIKDRASGKSKGYGFVEMPNRTEALAAIEGLNGQELGERTLKVSEAKPKGSGSSSRGRGPRRPARSDDSSQNTNQNTSQDSSPDSSQDSSSEKRDVPVNWDF